MLRKLNRYNLDFKKANEYFDFIFGGGNTLSSKLQTELNFENGQFFTLLPDDADFSALYEFERGWILPQNPTHFTYDEQGNRKGSYTWIPKLNYEI